MDHIGIVFIKDQAELFDKMPVMIADKCYRDDQIFMTVNDGHVSGVNFESYPEKCHCGSYVVECKSYCYSCERM